MNKQKGGLLVTALVLLGIFVSLAAFLVATYVSTYNYGNRAERQLEAVWMDNQNILAQYSLRIGEMAQVPDMFRDDLKEVFTAAMTGRYGEDGSQAVFQWLREQNPQLDPGIYNRLQQSMEAGRNEFRVAQTKLVDIRRDYETNLGYLWRGTWLRIAGYPKVDLARFTPITSDYASEAFSTGVDRGIQIR